MRGIDKRNEYANTPQVPIFCLIAKNVSGKMKLCTRAGYQLAIFIHQCLTDIRPKDLRS